MPAIMASVSPAAIKNKLIFAGVSFVNNPRSLDFVSGTADIVSWSDVLAALRLRHYCLDCCSLMCVRTGAGECGFRLFG